MAMTEVVVECPRECPQPTQTYNIHHSKMQDLNGDLQRIQEWLFNGYTDCAYCDTRKNIRLAEDEQG